MWMSRKELRRFIYGAMTNGAVTLDLSNQDFTELPPEIGGLTGLKVLDLRNNELTSLPPEIGGLTALKVLRLDDNELTSLPSEIGGLILLKVMFIEGNPLSDPPPETVARGNDAVLSYLREREKEGARHWVSKLVLVGEGGVGKSCLLDALMGRDFEEGKPTTHGIEVETFELEHPTEDAAMSLRCWDFGGQIVYHATHQFFLSKRSLFLLVWNTRTGFDQSNIYYWLDAITARAPDSPILIVATHTDQRAPDLPFADLQRNYLKVLRHYPVNNKDGDGIDELKEAIRDVASDPERMPLMGRLCPASWLRSAGAVNKLSGPNTTPRQLHEVLKNNGVKADDFPFVTDWLHDLGDVLYFRDDNDLNDIVVLEPQWVSKQISRVLDSEKVFHEKGLLKREEMERVWADHEPHMQETLLRFMERFDLSYRTEPDRKNSLVVEWLPYEEPNFRDRWNAALKEEPCWEISMRFQLNTLPPGIPTWFIARSHRFTTNTHWRTGALFSDQEKKHLALLETNTHRKFLRLTVRGPYPQNFFSLLRDGMEVTFARYPGLDIKRFLRCPGHDGKVCDYEFDFENLLDRLEINPPKDRAECQKIFKEVSIPFILSGLHPSGGDERLRRMEKTLDKVKVNGVKTLDGLRAMAEQMQRDALVTLRREQAELEASCPGLFTIRVLDGGWSPKKLIAEKMGLQLYCEAPGHWHPAGDPYSFDNPKAWVKKFGPHMRFVLKVLQKGIPVAENGLDAFLPDYGKALKRDMDFLEALAGAAQAMSLAELDGDDWSDVRKMDGAGLRTIESLLQDLDPSRHWGGLQSVLTSEGHRFWLCPEHAEFYKT